MVNAMSIKKWLYASRAEEAARHRMEGTQTPLSERPVDLKQKPVKPRRPSKARKLRSGKSNGPTGI